MQGAHEGMDRKSAAVELTCTRFADGEWTRTTVHVAAEMELTIYVNQQELVTVLCTPDKLNFLVLGFLYAEGIINGVEDVVQMRLCADEAFADVRLKDPGYRLPAQKILTSGCGGGVTFQEEGQKVVSDLVVAPENVLSLMKKFQEKMDLYRLSGGVHTSALADPKNLLVAAEDIGRHNTLDKIQGECLVRGLSTKDRLLLTTGRVSSEMLLKAARMQVPIVVSRHSPTGKTVSLAHELGIALVGYVRGGRFLVYSHAGRLGCPAGD